MVLFDIDNRLLSCEKPLNKFRMDIEPFSKLFLEQKQNTLNEFIALTTKIKTLSREKRKSLNSNKRMLLFPIQEESSN